MPEPLILPAWERTMTSLAEGLDLDNTEHLNKLHLKLYRETLRRSVGDLRSNAMVMRGDGAASTTRVDVLWDIVNAWRDYGSPAKKLQDNIDAELIVQAANALEKRYETSVSREAELMESVALLMRTVAHGRDVNKIGYRAQQLARSILEG